jgi:hypothetical protein
MTCADCQLAAKALHHVFGPDACCRARAAARSPQASAAIKGGRQTHEYRALLRGMEVTHDQVKAAADNDRACDRLLRKGAIA